MRQTDRFHLAFGQPLHVLAFVVGLFFTSPALAQSLPLNHWTVLIHGRTSTLGGFSYDNLTNPADPGGWMGKVAQAISDLDPGAVNIYKMNDDTFDLVVVQGTSPSDTTKHHVLHFDWTATSDIFVPGGGSSPNGDDGYSYAAGDALYALLARYGATDRVQALIGYSRGVPVASETTRRLILRGAAPKQVINLDGEGEGGTIFIRPDYIDQVFDAWSAGTNPIDWRNIRANPALGNVGGAPNLPGASNLDLTATHNHGGDVNDNPPPVWKYLIDPGNLTVQREMFVIAGAWTTPNIAAQPSPTDPAFFPAPAHPTPPILFNGDFQWGSGSSNTAAAGWSAHGAGGNGLIFNSSGDYALGLGAAFSSSTSRTHSWLALPPGQNDLSLTLDIFDASPGEALVARFETFDGFIFDLDPIILSTIGTQLVELNVPTDVSGAVVRLQLLLVTGGGAPTASVIIDDINITNTPGPLGDLNGDGLVDGADLATLLSQWNTDGSADLNDDGAVNGADLAALLANWTG
jgi:hypothetical protein